MLKSIYRFYYLYDKIITSKGNNMEKRITLKTIWIFAVAIILMLAAIIPAQIYAENVSDMICGDIDGDGRLTSTDLSIMIRYLSGWDVGHNVIDTADMNSDGKINNRDAIAVIVALINADDEPEVSIDTIYVAADGEGDGTSPDNALSDLKDAVALAAETDTDKTIVICGTVPFDLSSHWTSPEHTGKITILGENAQATLAVTTNDASVDNNRIWYAGGELEFSQLHIELQTRSAFVINTHLHDITFGEGMRMTTKSTVTSARFVSIRIADKDTTRCFDTEAKTYYASPTVTLNSGRFTEIVGFQNVTKANVKGDLEGTFTVNLSGNTTVNKLVVCRSAFATVKNVVFNINGGAILDWVASCDRPASELNTSHSGVTEGGSFTINVGADFDVLRSFTSAHTTAFYGFSGTSCSISAGANYLQRANYIINIDKAIESDVIDKVRAESFDNLHKLIFIADGGTGDGSSLENALPGIKEAVALASEANVEVTVIVCGVVGFDLSTNWTDSPAHKKIHIMGADSQSKLAVTTDDRNVANNRLWHMGGDLEFSNLHIELQTRSAMLFNTHFHDITFGDGMTITTKSTVSGARLVSIRIADSNTVDTFDEETKLFYANPTITLKSGTFTEVVGFQEITAAKVKGDLEGTFTVNISGDTKITKLVICRNAFSTIKNVVFNIDGGEFVDWVAACDRTAAQIEANHSGVTEGGTFTINIGAGFDVSKSFLAATSETAYFGFSGTSCSKSTGSDYLDRATYTINIDEAVYDAVIEKVRTESFDSTVKVTE